MNTRLRRSLAAAALLTGVTGPLVVAPAAVAASPATDAAGPNGVVVSLVSVRRSSSALDVTLTVANRGTANLQTSQLHDYLDQRPLIGVMALDPSTGKAGEELGSGTTCQCTALPVFLPAGQQITTTIAVADPGGSTIDLVFDTFGPITGIPVSGSAGSSDGLRTLEPRSQSLLSRSKNGAAQVKQKGGAVTGIDLDTDLLFAFNSATLSPSAGSSLRLAAGKLKAQPGRRVGIYGHTDAKGAPSYNQNLSRQRAQAVHDALAPLLGAGWTFDVRGFGETRPLVPEKTAEGADYPAGRRLNRRVELTVIAQ